MVKYKLTVKTGDRLRARTTDRVFVTLIGSDGESERTELTRWSLNVFSKTKTYDVDTKPLGELLLIKLEMERWLFFFPKNQWFCSHVGVLTPEGKELFFPCHRWLSRGEPLEFREAKALTEKDETHDLLKEHREKDKKTQTQRFQWNNYKTGILQVSDFDRNTLPPEHTFSISKTLEFGGSIVTFLMASVFPIISILKKLGCGESWASLEELKSNLSMTPITEFVSDHWRMDAFYGYQFLNGVHPSMIRRCKDLPSNFPVTEEMVQSFLEAGTSLTQAIQKGNVFLCDYPLMEGLPTRKIDGESVPLAAALCLLYQDTAGDLKPIAIQLGQKPSEECPIFIPSDGDDWLLAKMFVKNADSLMHQVVSHLMKTHLLAEVFAVATMRNLPVVHPLHKMLMPHYRFTLPINIAARERLIGKGGFLTKSTLDQDGLVELMRRAQEQMTYSSLCLPEDIAKRGMEDIPNFHYRDDGLELWEAINRFVRSMLGLYYSTDKDVSEDEELQRWISDIFTKGFLANPDSGIPESFSTLDDVVKFVTMVIFTSSAQHAVVNNGQLDDSGWYPNSPLLLRKKLPTAKGTVTMKTILETLPKPQETLALVILSHVLSENAADSVKLGHYPKQRFHEPAPMKVIEDFQKELDDIEHRIKVRNATDESNKIYKIPYTYLIPSKIENSVAI